MLVCSQCPKPFHNGHICVKCSRLYCSEHSLGICPLCKGHLEELSTEDEKVDNFTVQWLLFRNSKSVGASGLDSLPSYTSDTIMKMALDKSALKIILFSSKADSVKYEKILMEKKGQPFPGKMIIEKSRYTIFFNQESDVVHLLLNESAITATTISFLVSFFTKLLAKFESHKDIFEKHYKELAGIFADVFFSYSHKMSIPFASADEMTLNFVHFMVRDIQLGYLEGLVIRELSSEGAFNDLADYLTYKITTSFETFDYEMRFQLIEVYQILRQMLLIAALIAFTSQFQSLSKNVENYFNRLYAEFRTKYSELPDLLRAIDSINANRDQISFSSYDEYIKTIGQLANIAFHEIEARYVSLGEAVALIKLSEFYLDGLQRGECVFQPRLGFIDNYIEILEKIFAKEGIYPEVRVIAGMALEDILFAWAFKDHDYLRLLKLVDHIKQFCKLVEESIPEIMKKNGTISGFTGSPLTYEDAILKALSASKMARSFGDLKTEKELYTIADRMATQYDLASSKAQLWMGKFAETQNLTYLFKIHEVINKIDFEKFSYLRAAILPINLLAEAILYREDIERKIDQAREIVLNDMSEPSRNELYATQHLQTTEALYHILGIFKWLLLSAKSETNMRKAYIESLALQETLMSTDPLNMIALRTRLLYKLSENNLDEASSICRNLNDYSSKNDEKSPFLKQVTKWIEVCKRQNERRFVYQKDFAYEGSDLWMQLLHSSIEKSMEEDLLKSISGSHAVVFIEGDTDVFVLDEFAKKLHPDFKISFIDSEGFGNVPYFANAQITKELKIPIYSVFDGDTRETKKQDVISRFRSLSIDEGFIYTLRENSIENYLLNPHAIKRAFPDMSLNVQDIEDFFQKNRDKRNKKVVLDYLFRSCGFGGYDKDVARKIAEAFDKSEIDSELVQLLAKVRKLEKLQ